MIFAKNFARNYEKKIILGTSDAWLMSLLAHRPRDPAYYIEDWPILYEWTNFHGFMTKKPSGLWVDL